MFSNFTFMPFKIVSLLFNSPSLSRSTHAFPETSYSFLAVCPGFVGCSGFVEFSGSEGFSGLEGFSGSEGFSGLVGSDGVFGCSDSSSFITIDSII